MKANRLTLTIGLALMILTTIASKDLVAFQRYNDGCQSCHSAFTDNFSTKPNNTWPDSKHNVHRFDMLDGVCDACHLNGDNHNPFLNMSNGTNDLLPVGCVGCHGRYYGSSMADMGVGLREHHFNSGVTTCVSCHSDDPTPLSEMAMPEYYGKPTVNITFPCNFDGSENWTPDGLGLDNDGDLNYDGDDGGCPQKRTPLFHSGP